ncbi:MAG: energy-coupling factor ABC transporter ATP-binding protein [Bacteroidota bacterium]
MKFELVDIAFSYSSRVGQRAEVLRGLNLSIESGECLGIIGREGAGKTTLLQILDGLLLPNQGKLIVDGALIDSPAAALRLRHEVGFAFQFPEEQMFCETVREELLYGIRQAGLAQVRTPEESLQIFGLDPLNILELSPFALSPMEARFVALASLLVPARRALLFDEPTVGLDAHGLRNTIDVLRKLRADGLTIVVVSHDIDMLAELVDSVAVLKDGCIALKVSATEAFCTPGLMERYGYEPPEIVTALNDYGTQGMHLKEGVFRFDQALEVIRRARS